jgi:V-type H+-transporting ATPase subunit a
VSGVIVQEKMGIFERILFRALRGNLYMNFSEIDEQIIDPATDEMVRKNVFCIFAHGRELVAKIRKICESLGATLYEVDQDSGKRRSDGMMVASRIEDLRQVLDNTRNARRIELAKYVRVLTRIELQSFPRCGAPYSSGKRRYIIQ